MTAINNAASASIENKATYDYNLAAAQFARKTQADYGRLVLFGLICAHAVGVAVILQQTGPSIAALIPAFGLALAFGAGAAAWTNWTFLALVHAHWADGRLLTTSETVSEVDVGAKKLIADLAYAGAIALTLLSAAAIPAAVGAYLV